MDVLTIILAGMTLSGPVFLALWLLSLRKINAARGQVKEMTFQINALEDRLRPITDIEEAVEKKKGEIAEFAKKISELREVYKDKKKYLDQLLEQVAVYDERLAFAELGMYEPHFDFTDSEAFKAAIEACRLKQKDMVAKKKAVSGNMNWTVDGSKAKGQTMVNRQVRLTMRAFNNEAEAAIANVRWNNVNAMEKRVHSAAKAIDDSNASMSISINPKYIALKIEEIRLTHEYREKQKTEKDERAEAARLSREEAKLLRDAEAAEREEAKYAALLDKARKEAEASAGNVALAEKVTMLETQLLAAHAAAERAQAMAEMTRTGYVYIISNVGSFGEDVVKIGLTRRLDPDDRVRELGDASVPFSFDTHAMIYSDNAPALEAALHANFAKTRLNLQNMRKEFFRIGIDEVEEAVKRLAPDAAFFRDREAQEWHETLARRNASLAAMQGRIAMQLLPEAI